MKKLYLEFIRGIAAVTVLLYHTLELHPTHDHSKHLYFSTWGTDAVMVFFILSGIVINISQSRNPKSRSKFIANRLLRIYPQLSAGLLVGLLVLGLTYSAIPSGWTIAGNFLMLSALKGYMNNIVPCIESNGPIWSLSFEMVFYLLFALVIGRFQKRAMIAWFLLSLAVMPLYYSAVSIGSWGHIFAVITFSSIWLTGYFVYEYRNYFYADKYAALFSAGMLPLVSGLHLSVLYYDPVKYLLFAVMAIPFFRFCLQEPASGKKIRMYYLVIPYLIIAYFVYYQPYLTFRNFALYCSFPILMAAGCYVAHLFNFKDKLVDGIRRTGAFLGKFSYSLYIIHYPLLFLCAYLFQSVTVYVLVGLPSACLTAYCLEKYLQPAVVSFFRKLRKSSAIPYNLNRIEKLA